jgi:hypothetical protein
MPPRAQTVKDAIRIFEEAEYTGGLTLETAWLGIYQALLWYEPVNILGIRALPHIIDANNLRPPPSKKVGEWRKPKKWQIRAQAVERYIAEKLDCSLAEVESKVDRLMRSHEYAGMQRQNSLGTAFTGIVSAVLERFGAKGIEYELERDAAHVFPGIVFPGRSSAPRIDILATKQGIPRAVISAKWSVRDDRVNDITNECPVYKEGYNRIHRGRGDRLFFYVLTNEFQSGRLAKMLKDSCTDGVVHVHKPLVVEVCEIDGHLASMLDLTDLVSQTSLW